MSASFADSPIPRYLQVADVLRQRIARGMWHLGDCLPSLEQLVSEFGVARVTVRQSIELLAREGLVSAQQGRGTFVTAVPNPARPIRVETTLDALTRDYADTRATIVTIDEVSGMPSLRPGEGVPVERYVFMRRVHTRDGEPYCVINLHLDERLFRKNPAGFRDKPVIPLLTNMKGLDIAAAHQTLTIGAADMEVAKQLKIAVNAPVANVRRVFTGTQQQVIYLAELTYRGDAIHFEMDLKP